MPDRRRVGDPRGLEVASDLAYARPIVTQGSDRRWMMDDTGTIPDGEELEALREQLAQRTYPTSSGSSGTPRTPPPKRRSCATRRRHHAKQRRRRPPTPSRCRRSWTARPSANKRPRPVPAIPSCDWSPVLPADLIVGADIDAHPTTGDRAARIAARVRSHIEAQAQIARVPAGTPPRAAPDLSALNARARDSRRTRRSRNRLLARFDHRQSRIVNRKETHTWP